MHEYHTDTELNLLQRPEAPGPSPAQVAGATGLHTYHTAMVVVVMVVAVVLVVAAHSPRVEAGALQ